RCVWLLRAPGALRGNPYVHYLNFGRVAPALSHHHRMQTGSTAMLTHSAIERTSTAHQPARPNTTSAGSKAFQSSIELMGAPMPFGRNAEIYGENEPAEYIYKVISGTVRTYKVLNDRRRAAARARSHHAADQDRAGARRRLPARDGEALGRRHRGRPADVASGHR